MQKIEVLNTVAHEHLRVNPKFSAELGDNVASTFTYVTEFLDIQKEYPILCRKDPLTGEYQAVVLLGFEKDENLFLTEMDPINQKWLGWKADCVPAVIARGPFSIGIQRGIVAGSEMHKPVVHIDMNHPKAMCEDGQMLFLENGGHSPYLRHISTVLDTINEGMYLTKLMFDAFNRHQLLEDVVLDIEFNNQEKLKIAEFQTINSDKLSELNGDALEELNKLGFLQAAYYIVASISNVKKLIDKKNQKNIAFGEN